MLKRSDIRIAAALAISMVTHGMVLMWNYGVTQSPVTGIARQKLTFQMTARQVVKPEKPVKEPEKGMQQEIREEKPEKKPVVQQKSIISSHVEPLPEPVAPPVKEVYQVVPEPVIQQTQPEDVTSIKTQEDTLTQVAQEGGEQDKPEVVMARPLYRQNPPPEYPEKARRRRLEGTVVLEVHVSSEGSVDDLQVKESSGHRILDRAAVSSVRRWLFVPGLRNGSRVAMTVLVPVRFALQ